MESHDNTNDAACQSLISDINSGEPTRFLYYSGGSPFCPSKANESRWVRKDFRTYYPIVTDPSITIKCLDKGMYSLSLGNIL